MCVCVCVFMFVCVLQTYFFSHKQVFENNIDINWETYSLFIGNVN